MSTGPPTRSTYPAIRSAASGIATTPIEPGVQPVPARSTAVSPPPGGTSTMLVRSACIAW